MKNILIDYDVIVIGSGPSGSGAAITCVQLGLSVLLILKNKSHSGEDDSIESIHPGISTLLAQLNIDDCLTQASVGTYEGIQSADNISRLGSDENGIWLGHHISRSIFDAELLKIAISQNVMVVNNETVNDFILEDDCVIGIKTSSNKEFFCKYVIDASGFKCFGGTKLNFKKVYFSPPLISWTGVSIGIESENLIFSNRYAKFIPETNGWSWLAPIPPNQCAWTRLSIKGEQAYLSPETLQKYPTKGNIKKANMRWRLFRPLCKEGIILCGDAAGILDPAAGQGILNALYSGIKAGQTVISVLTNPDFESLYLAEYVEWFYNQYVEKANMLKSYYREHRIEIFQ